MPFEGTPKGKQALKKLVNGGRSDYVPRAMLLGIMLGTMEIIVILVVVLVIFGPSRLPQLGSSVGKMLSGFKKEMREIGDEEGAEGEVDVTPADPDVKDV